MSQTVRAKFTCSSVEKTDQQMNVTMEPVMDGSDENKSFWEYTPSGSIQLIITNPLVEFETGAEYYVDFTKAE